MSSQSPLEKIAVEDFKLRITIIASVVILILTLILSELIFGESSFLISTAIAALAAVIILTKWI